MSVKQILLTPKIGKVYYDNYADYVFHVSSDNQGTVSDPFIIKVDGINTYEELCYNERTNSQKIINIVFDNQPTNYANLLESFYVKFINVEGSYLKDTPILFSFENKVDEFPIGKNISIKANKDNNNVITFIGTLGGNASGTTLSSVIPTKNKSEGKKGTLAVDSDFLYICISDNTWRKVALSNISDAPNEILLRVPTTEEVNALKENISTYPTITIHRSSDTIMNVIGWCYLTTKMNNDTLSFVVAFTISSSSDTIGLFAMTDNGDGTYQMSATWTLNEQYANGLNTSATIIEHSGVPSGSTGTANNGTLTFEDGTLPNVVGIVYTEK